MPRDSIQIDAAGLPRNTTGHPESPNLTARHIGNPPGLCLGRTFLIQKVGKASVGSRRASPGAAGGRFGTASPCGRPPVWPPRWRPRPGRVGQGFRGGRCSRPSPWTTRTARHRDQAGRGCRRAAGRVGRRDRVVAGLLAARALRGGRGRRRGGRRRVGGVRRAHLSHPVKDPSQRTKDQDETEIQPQLLRAIESAVLVETPSFPASPAEQPSKPPPATSPEHPTHYEPPGSVPGPHLLDRKGQQVDRGRFPPGGRRPIVARLRRAFGRAYGRPEGSDLRSFGTGANERRRGKKRFALTGEGAEECTGARQMAAGGFSRRRRSLVPVGFRGGRSTGRLREGSCGRRGCATAFVFGPTSWSAGSASARLRPRLPRRRRRVHLEALPRGAACERCSAVPRKARRDDR